MTPTKITPCVFVFSAALASAIYAQDVVPFVVTPAHADRSGRLDAMAAARSAPRPYGFLPYYASSSAKIRAYSNEEKGLFKSSLYESSRIERVLDGRDFSKESDEDVQFDALRILPVAAITGFEGLGGGFRLNGITFVARTPPPDPAGAAGTTQYVQWVNGTIAVFDKNGNAIMPPVPGDTVWAGMKGPCSSLQRGDPIVLFDRVDNRWVLSQAAGGPPHSQCIAVSDTEDATGSYTRYDFSFDDGNMNDYGKLAVWSDGYYATYLMYDRLDDQKPIGTMICAYNRKEMLKQNTAAGGQCAMLKTGALLPSDAEGKAGSPAGMPNFIVGIDVQKITLRRFFVNWADASQSKIKAPIDIKVRSFVKPDTSFWVVQRSGGDLDPIGDRPMFRCSYREAGTRSSLMFNHTVQVPACPTSTVVCMEFTAAVRWYEILDPQSAPSVAQQSTYRPSIAARWMGSIAMDKNGNMALGYSTVSGTLAPSLYIAGRSAHDTFSTLSAELRVVDGNSATSDTRWGDYSMMTLDPTDDCTFWFTGEYLKDPAADARWHTYIAYTKFNDCN